jgi:hypothetical protein
MVRSNFHQNNVLSIVIAAALAAAPGLAAADEGAGEGAPEPAPAPPAAEPAPASKVTPGVSSDPVAPPSSPVALDLWPGVGTSSLGRGQDHRALSLGLVTWSGSIDGADLSAVGGVVEGDVQGVQASGLVAMTRGSVEGAQLGAALSTCSGDVDGVAGAGGLSVVRGDVDGLVAAGFGVISGGAVDGVSAAGFVAMNGPVDGVQAAGFLTFARGPVDGVQASGFLNVAQGDVEGVQAGVINLSRGEVDGLMLGVVNIADDADVALGLINVLRNGRHELELGASERGAGHLLYKSGSRRVHNILSAELRPREEGGSWAAGLGIGVHQPIIGDWVWTDLDLVASHQSGLGQLHLGVSELGVARAMVGVQLGPKLSVTGGPTWNGLLTVPRAIVAPPPSAFPVVDTQTDALRLRQWPGVQVGVQLHAPRREG